MRMLITRTDGTGVVLKEREMPQLWRVRHDIELGPLWRPRLPEVFPFFPNHFTPFPEAWQRLSFAMNPHLTPERWTSVYSNARAFTNGNGYGDDTDPRANYITGENLTCALPKVECLTCGGALLAGRVEGINFVPETLNGRLAPPSLEWLLARPWLYFHAVTVDQNGTPRMFPQGDMKPVLIPFIADRNRYPVITISLSKLEKLDMSQPLPSPYAIRM